jgi:hypothetical protein
MPEAFTTDCKKYLLFRRRVAMMLSSGELTSKKECNKPPIFKKIAAVQR